ncbi:adenylate/guanylate cyclase domain-containing protein [Chloroflexus sp.]|uniref:adenylate/guanylate cyclase domain-containing protein n=1 Tax=Chloroflexus sp. TaxID=1904827 RepID=UPI0026333596|nr:adenylate/guanylate cyclase domain-containing protein [uncultured Chloroflexus sp.]
METVMVSPLIEWRDLREHLTDLQVAEIASTGNLAAATRAEIARRLREQIVAYAAYIPARIVQHQLAHPQPGRTTGAFWEGTLLFADLSGFTNLSERLSVLGRQGAEEVSALVNRLFAALLQEVQMRSGMLLKFGGDALTVFFDSATLGDQHALAACAAALAMQRRMEEFAHLETRAGTFTLRLRVGVHAGRVFAAEVGDTSHIELVVTGPEVNRVALAQEIAAPGEVVITEHTRRLLGGHRVEPRHAGFSRLLELDFTATDITAPQSLSLADSDDLATLNHLARQLAALKPYLVHRLPRRFLDPGAGELGEFRPVTVLFANVYDFSGYLTMLPDAPELAATIFNTYYQRAQAVVHRYEGIINKVDMYTHGDKLMALFGAPTAHEDDPIRAARCALELRQTLREANRAIAELIEENIPLLEQKIGINTGTVFAGRVGGATRYEYTVMGPAVNLAARLMAAAPTGAIYLSPSTRATVEGQFVLEPGEPLQLKGFSEAVVPAQVTQIAAVATRHADEHLLNAPLIGRDAELRRVLTTAQAALKGQGATIAVVGEAGAGKSRLAEEVIQQLVIASTAHHNDPEEIPPFTILFGDCQSYEQRTAYAAIRAPLLSALGLDLRATPDQIAADTLARIQQLAPDFSRFTPLLADALGLPLTETPLTIGLSPQQRHDRLQELLVEIVLATAAREPVLLVLEDCHWADSPSLEVLERLSKAARTRALALIVTYRPEMVSPAPWDNLPGTARIELGELQVSDSQALLAALLGGEPPPEILPLLERTQGNPFFIEELVRALVRDRVLARDVVSGRWQLTRLIDKIELPRSIEGLLIARLDRLDEPRQELVQVASVIGRRFHRPVVEGVYSNPTTLDESIQRLIESELIQADQQERILAYIFRHALLRDVAYEGILYARRRALHARVARRIEEIAANQLEDQYAVLAWHFLQAEEWQQAFHYHAQAAGQVRRRFANHDAVALYTTALNIAPRLTTILPPAQLIEQVADIHEAIGELHLVLGEYDAAEHHFREALQLSLPIGNEPVSERWLRMHRMLASVEERRSRYQAAFDLLTSGMARAHRGLQAETARCYLLGAGIAYRTGDYAHAMEWAKIGYELAVQTGNPIDQARALKIIGNIANDQGDRTQAIDALNRARALYEQATTLSGLCDVLNDLGRVYTQAGRWAETIAVFEQSMAISENIGDVLATARTANNLAVVLVGRNQLERAAELYQRASDLFARLGSRLGVAVTGYNRGEVLLNQGRAGEALALFTIAIADIESINARSFLPEVLRLAALAALALGDLDQARSNANRSLAIAEELGQVDDSAIANRVLGEIALAAGDLAVAEDLFTRSSATLAQLDNRYELGKVRYQQARLALARHDSAAAVTARAEAIAIFTELDAQRDLALAQALPV